MSLKPDEELARLREEAAALDDQVKLLVRTEQRLFRSQKELNAQLSRMQALTELSLSGSPSDTEEVILGRGLCLLQSMFHVDCVIAVKEDPSSEACLVCDVHGQAHWVPISKPMSGWVQGASHAQLVSLDSWEELEHVRALFELAARAGFAGDPDRGTQLAALQILGSDAPVRLGVFAWKRQSFRRSALRERFQPTHRAFLHLLSEHLRKAVEAAALTRALAQRGDELGRANVSLSESLTSLQQAQAQLIQAQKMDAIGRLAGGLAHDFNNLLCATLNCCDVIDARLPPTNPLSKYIGVIRDSTEQAANLTRQLLAFSRKQAVEATVLRLPELIEKMQEMLGALLGDKVELVVESQPDTRPIWADPGQVHQILINLAVNARDAMPSGGRLVIETRNLRRNEFLPGIPSGPEPQAYVVLSVHDTGCGMDANTRSRLFEPFFTTKAHGEGTGLGLATVHGIVRQHGGHISVQSEVGRGTVFALYFPVAAQQNVPEKQAHHASAEADSERGSSSRFSRHLRWHG